MPSASKAPQGARVAPTSPQRGHGRVTKQALASPTGGDPSFQFLNLGAEIFLDKSALKIKNLQQYGR
jgi:hypothetical protein